MDIALQLAKEFKVRESQVKATISLIDEGNTIPFIARYRKEMTGSLDDILLRDLSERLDYLRGLEDRKSEVKRLIEEQGKLDRGISCAIEEADTMQKLDDIYRPFRPKRRTRATMAKERGLELLADTIYSQPYTDSEIGNLAERFVDKSLDVEDVESAIAGAKDIIAETIADNADYRELVRDYLTSHSSLLTVEIAESDKEKKGKERDREVYKMYFDFSEKISRLVSHRVLAINRAESEKIIRVKIDGMDEKLIEKLSSRVKNRNKVENRYLLESIEDSYKRLLFPSIEREIRNTLTESAQEKAIRVFGQNLKPLLLQAPINNAVVMGFDPAYRTGCKIAVVDETGKLLEYTTIYPTPPQSKVEESVQTMKAVIEKYGVSIIAIGNGTGSRESESIVAEMISEMDREICYTIVNEAGASVYSASVVGAQEYPDIDVSIRGAISIGKRLQDPLAELVKIEPKHIGVGQYQHDLNQSKLDETLSGVVESSVNSVGVDLNTASVSLLGYVSGLSNSVAKNIFNYRQEHGKFKNRKQLLEVKRLGKATFIQSAGFLRISDGDNILDYTGVHPESYGATEKLLKKLSVENTRQALRDFDWDSIGDDIGSLSEELSIGEITLRDIIEELKKPGRDPREEMIKPVFRSDVVKMEDLKEGMLMMGTVRNVVDFGAFVDIGVKQDGLVHISNLSNSFIKNPMDIVSVGDTVEVRIIELNIEKNKIGLSIKDV